VYVEDAPGLLRLLGDEVRLRLLRLLSLEALNVSELTGILGIAQSGVSRHLGLLRDAGLVDAFRALHPDAREVSWAFSHGGGWRLDHVLASPSVRIEASGYHHDWRRAGLSDHAAMEADLLVESSTR